MLVASVKRGKPLDAPVFCFLVFHQFSTKAAKTEILTGATVILQGLEQRLWYAENMSKTEERDV
jgi:hypothetical protein